MTPQQTLLLMLLQQAVLRKNTHDWLSQMFRAFKQTAAAAAQSVTVCIIMFKSLNVQIAYTLYPAMPSKLG